MTKIILNDDTADYIRQKAIERGYDDPTSYLLDLVDADSSIAETDNQEIKEGFKQAFKQALQGKVLSREEFKRRLK